MFFTVVVVVNVINSEHTHEFQKQKKKNKKTTSIPKITHTRVIRLEQQTLNTRL